MKLKELLRKGNDRLHEAGITEDTDAKILLAHVVGFKYSDLMLHYEEEAEISAEEAYLNLIEKRATRIPCQYLVGRQDFMGYEFDVAPGVLIPRPETELLVEEAVRQASVHFPEKKSLSVLDLCTGSGCIGIAYHLMREKAGFSDDVMLSDISYEALSVAAKNRDRLAPSVRIVKSDLFDGFGEDTFDLILSNPPYIPSEEIGKLEPEVKDHEPHLALDGDASGLVYYERIAEEATGFLRENGRIIFEIGFDQGETVPEILRRAGYDEIAVMKDYAGLDRIVSARCR